MKRKILQLPAHTALTFKSGNDAKIYSKTFIIKRCLHNKILQKFNEVTNFHFKNKNFSLLNEHIFPFFINDK